MKRVPTTDNLRLAILLEMLEEVSRATDPQDAVAAFAGRIRKLRQVDVLVGVSVRGLQPGEYAITRLYTAADASTPLDALRQWDARAIHTGGFVGEVIGNGEVQLITDLNVPTDPVLGERLAEMGSCMAFPLFEDGRAHTWALYFRRSPDGYTLGDLEVDLLVNNLFGSMARNLATLEQVEALNARLRAQFDDLARVQKQLLPVDLPEGACVHVATSYVTSEAAGGDYYDFFPLGPGRLGVLIADVSGHGAAAATVVARMHAILHAYDGWNDGPAAALEFASHQLTLARLEGGFVTGVLAVWDADTRILRLARAGHPAPRRVRVSGEVEALHGPFGLPMGILDEGYEVPEYDVQLEVGDTIVLFTDGITETFDSTRAMFGEAGLDASLARAAGRKPEAVIDRVQGDLVAFAGNRTVSDDQTMVVLRVMDNQEPCA